MASEIQQPAWLSGERAARALRFEMALGHAPIDVYDVIGRRGVGLAFRDLGGDDGRYIFHSGVGLIIVNSTTEEASRQRFTAAHELGHHELHRFSEDAETPTYLVDKSVYATGGDRREVEANAFAASFLLPTEVLQAEFPQRGKVTVEQVAEIMRRYRVSLPTAVYRLHNSGRITAATRDALLGDGEGHIHDLLGDVEPPMPAGAPTALRRDLEKLYRAGLVGPERLAESLDIGVDDVIKRFGEAEPAGAHVDALLSQLAGRAKE